MYDYFWGDDEITCNEIDNNSSVSVEKLAYLQSEMKKLMDKFDELPESQTLKNNKVESPNNSITKTLEKTNDENEKDTKNNRNNNLQKSSIPPAPSMPISIPPAPSMPISIPPAPSMPISIPSAPSMPISIPSAPSMPVQKKVVFEYSAQNQGKNNQNRSMLESIRNTGVSGLKHVNLDRSPGGTPMNKEHKEKNFFETALVKKFQTFQDEKKIQSPSMNRKISDISITSWQSLSTSRRKEINEKKTLVLEQMNMNSADENLTNSNVPQVKKINTPNKNNGSNHQLRELSQNVKQELETYKKANEDLLNQEASMINDSFNFDAPIDPISPIQEKSKLNRTSSLITNVSIINSKKFKQLK